MIKEEVFFIFVSSLGKLRQIITAFFSAQALCETFHKRSEAFDGADDWTLLAFPIPTGLFHSSLPFPVLFAQDNTLVGLLPRM